MRLIYIADAPLPYDTPIMNELHLLVDLHVVYFSKSHALYQFTDDWGEDAHFSNSRHWSKSIRIPGVDFATHISLGVSQTLNRLKPDVILCKSWAPITLEPLLWKTVAKKKSVMWSESTVFSGLLRGSISNKVRKIALATTDAFVTNGSQATLYLQHLGAEAPRIITSCLPTRVAEQALRVGAYTQREDSLHHGPHFLYVGRLTPRKHPIEAIRAFGAIIKDIPQARLSVVGDGPLLPEVRRAAAAVGDAVTILGRREGAELSSIYQQADILVTPAYREVWGLVVNEALAHGLFVIATDQVGSAFDLLDKDSGTIVAAGDQRALIASMIYAGRTVPQSHADRARRASRVSDCNAQAFATCIYQAAQLALSTQRLNPVNE